MKHRAPPHNRNIAIPDQAFYPTRIQPAPASTLPKRTKSERQIDSLVFYLTNPQANGGRFFLCKNILNTKYVIWDYEIIFLGEDRLVNSIKSDVYFQAGENMTDAVIKSALKIISGKQELWIYDGKQKRITPIRSISLYKGHFIYFFNRNYFVSNNFDNKYITGVFVSKSLEMIQPPQDPNFLNEVDSTDYYDLSIDLYNLEKMIFRSLNIPDDYFLIILTWIVQSMASDNYTLLELIGESKSGKSHVQSILRNLIDPNLELITQAPKKIKDLEKQTMNGHVMSFDDVEKLNDEIQLFMVDLMSVNGAKITYPVESRECNAEIFVRRPIILNSVTPVVTHEKLQSKTLTIELKSPEKKWREYQEVDERFVYEARLVFLRLAKAIFDFKSNQSLPKCIYRGLYDFSEIGLRLSQILYSNTDRFEKQLNSLIKDQFLAKLEGNQTSYLTFLWAQQNANTQEEMSAANWIKRLEIYHDNSSGEWKITPKQFGSDLKKFAPVLRDFGIKCESLGKRGSFVRWKITTAEKIDLQAEFFEKSGFVKKPN
ncbi:MAG: hypothetical protein ACXVA2_20755 [Mucilaginibacter sp.]